MAQESTGKQEVVAQFMQFLRQEAQSNQGKAESLQIITDMLGEAFDVQAAPHANAITELVARIEESKKNPSAQQQQKKPEEEAEKDPKFLDFLRMIAEKGYFKNAPEGSPQYQERYKKAKEKFVQKQLEAKVQQAEKHKDEGNQLFKEKKYREAILCYQKASELNPENAIYHCNSAASHLQLGENDKVIKSAQLAIKLDSKYAKAYKWLGMAYMNIGELDEAIKAFTSATSLDPNNAEYAERLAEAKQKKQAKQQPRTQREQPTSQQDQPNPFGGLGGFQELLNNPAIRQMASQMMQNPQMQQMMQGMMSQFGGGDLSLPDIGELMEMEEVKNNEKLQNVIKDIQQNGMMAGMKYQNDPEVVGLLQKIGQKMMKKNPNLGKLFDSFGSAMGGNDEDDDNPDDSKMYS